MTNNIVYEQNVSPCPCGAPVTKVYAKIDTLMTGEIVSASIQYRHGSSECSVVLDPKHLTSTRDGGFVYDPPPTVTAGPDSTVTIRNSVTYEAGPKRRDCSCEVEVGPEVLVSDEEIVELEQDLGSTGEGMACDPIDDITSRVVKELRLWRAAAGRDEYNG